MFMKDLIWCKSYVNISFTSAVLKFVLMTFYAVEMEHSFQPPKNIFFIGGH